MAEANNNEPSTPMNNFEQSLELPTTKNTFKPIFFETVLEPSSPVENYEKI